LAIIFPFAIWYTAARNTSRQRLRTWTHDFCCLSNRSQTDVPGQDELLSLMRAGLGTKKLCFNADDSASSVSETIKSNYPKLQEAGGFELLILKSGRRGQASLISASVGPLPVTDLKHLTTGKIYIRPLQQDLSMSEQSEVQVVKEECLICGERMPIMDISAHRRLVHK
jgi:hypothetical protein